MSKNQKRSNPAPGVQHVQKKGNITEYSLIKNDLRILYVHIPESPTVTTNIVYHIGSQYEGPGETGITHMLEHMLFKPTITKSLTWEDLERRGANMNATTWLDRTMYYFNLPSEHLEDMLAVEADRMRNLAITNKEFQPERTNVLSEYEMYNSMPEAALEWGVMQTAFVNHGYHHDTIGYRHDIEGYTTDQLQKFYDTYYWPNNATLIVAGDISEQTLLTKIKKTFGKIPSSPKPILRPIQPEMKQEGQRRVVLERNTPMRICTIACKAPAFTNDDWLSLSLGLDYLTDGKTSPLYKKLVATGMASGVTASLYPTKDTFLASVIVTVSEKTSYADVEKIVFEAFADLGNKSIPTSLFAGIKTSTLADEMSGRDGSFKVASALAEYVASGDWARYADIPQKIQKTTAAMVKKSAKQYLQKSQSTIGTIGT